MMALFSKNPFLPSPSNLILSFVVTSLLVSGKTEARIQLPPNVSIPAVIVFGDSIMDTGNNNGITTIAKCNFPPYGKNFEGGIPTGRFCDGKVPSDLIAEELGIKELLPAYLDPNLKPEDLPTGVCFASGASGFDPLTSQIPLVFSLSDQLDMFREYIGKLKGIVGADRTNFILANSLVLVVSGTDDIANTYFLARIRQLQYDIPAYTDLMLNSATDFLKELYDLGVRRMGVFSTPPIGCLPSQRTLGGGIERQCAENYNDAAKLFNSKLSKQLNTLNHDLPDGRFVYIDIYNPLLDIIQNYQKYGLKVAANGCCGTGIIEVAVMFCDQAPTCPNPGDHVFWDSYHPTENTYRKLIGPLLRKYTNQFF